MQLRHTFAGGRSHMRPIYAVATRNVAGALAALVVGGPIAHRAPGDPVVVSARLWEWKVELSASTVPAGTVTFTVTNAGTIPHAFEIEGHGMEKETDEIQPGSSATFTLTLKLGTYEVYCPVGEGSHKKLGMETHLKVAGAQSSGAPGYGGSEVSEAHEAAEKAQSIRGTSGGPVIQILPGPFPVPDRRAPILPAVGDAREGLEAQAKNGTLVTDNAMVHVMLLSRTRRDSDFALACWDCSRNKIEELQLQILPGPGEPKFEAPGGFLFVNWEKSSSRKPAS